MVWLNPTERRFVQRRRLVSLTVFMIGFLIVSLFDRAAFEYFRVDDLGSIERRDWYRLLRVVGYLPLWAVLGAGLYLVDRSRTDLGRRPGDRALLLFLSPALAGLGAEFFKRLIGRERPGLTEDLYFFKPLLSGFVDDSNLGLPSSHGAVAFGGAFVLVYLFPRVWPVALGGAIGCGLTRLFAGAHFLTDVYAAAGLGYAVTVWLKNGPLGQSSGRASSRVYP